MTSHQTLIARPDNSCGKGGSIKGWPENDGEDGGGDCPASLICVSLSLFIGFLDFTMTRSYDKQDHGPGGER